MEHRSWVNALARLPARIRRNLGWRWRRVRKAWLRRVAFRRLRRAATVVEVSDQPAVIFAPHQDDETLGCGGLIAAKRQLGAPVTVVFVTDGGACLLDDPAPGARAAMSAVRRQEATRALQTLGVDAADIVFLDFPDAELSDLKEGDQQALIEALAAVLTRLAPREVLLPFRNDFHNDHRATHTLAKSALTASGLDAELWQYFVWSLWESSCLSVLSAEETARLVRIELQPAQRRQKQTALAEYRSQYQPDPVRRVILLPAGFVEFLSSRYEFFLRDS